MSSRIISWFSSGVASAVMTKISLQEFPDAIVVQCDLGSSEDFDNQRFSNECQDWFGREILKIKSAKYSDIDDVFERRKYHSGINGAPCTGEMKFSPRLDFQLPSDLHLWGYTADGDDIRRFNRMLKEYPNMKQKAPLIERGLTKSACFSMIENAGIKRPRVYDFGFPNGNCIGCVKATSPDYWSLVRKHFPEIFAKRADQSRRFGSRLSRINNERIFIDEIPEDWPTLDAIVPRCDFLCHIAQQDLEG